MPYAPFCRTSGWGYSEYSQRYWGAEIEPDPVLITLGVSVRARRLQVAQQRLLSYGLLAAKLILLLLEEEGTEQKLYI